MEREVLDRAEDAGPAGLSSPSPFEARAAAAVLAVLAFAASLGPVPSELFTAAQARGARANGAAALAATTPSVPTGLDIYRGLGSWVDIYDFSAWDDPEGTVADMAARGVRTLYLETSNYKRHKPFVFRQGTERFIEAAHAHGLAVVAWYLPGFDDVDRDYRRTMAAVDLVTPGGESFDSFALDIEAPLVQPPSLRTTRLLELSGRIRAAVGEGYTLGAIIPSPRGMQVNPDYWPGFPYPALAATYDVFVPMTYFTWRTSGLDGARHYTTLVAQIIRNRTGDPSVPIHIIGGISEEATTAEARGFVRAVRERGVIGGSFYGFPGTSPAQWLELARIPVNPVQTPPLPLPIGEASLGAVGNFPSGDRTHPKEVFYRTGGRAGDWTLEFEVFDVQAAELTLWVNWQRVATIFRSPDDAWSKTRRILIADGLLKDAGANFVAFTARGDHPDWSQWGVRSIRLTPG